MKLFVTDQYFNQSQDKIRALNVTLAKIRHDKTAAYTQDTNTWHDNFAYEHLTREEKQTEKHLTDLLTDMNNMQIVHADSKIAKDKVCLYCWVCVLQENTDTGVENEYRFGVVPLGAENIANNIYAYNTPLVHPLIGLSVGDDVSVCLPSGNFHMTIQSVEPMTQGDIK